MTCTSTSAPLAHVPYPASYLALEVSRFLRKHDIPPSRFGRDAVGDPRFASDLFSGRIPRPATAAKVRAYMAGGQG